MPPDYPVYQNYRVVGRNHFTPTSFLTEEDLTQRPGMRPLDQALFVVCWESSESVAEVCATLAEAGHREMSARRCLCMAWAMRKLGVNLKQLSRPVFPRQDIDLSAESLAAYAQSIIRKRSEQAV